MERIPVGFLHATETVSCFVLYPVPYCWHDNDDRERSDCDCRDFSVVSSGSSVVASRIHQNSLYRSMETLYRFISWISNRIRRLAVLLLTKLTSKEWLSANRWAIHVVFGFITMSMLIVFSYAFFVVVVRKIIWIYQHSECYTRESTIIWQEGRSHNMTRQCPPITQYRTVLNTNQRPRKIDNSKICITTLSDTKKRKTTIRCRNFDEVAKLTWPNHYAYGEKYGYTVVDHSLILDNTRPPAWSKIRAVQAMFALYKCDWVLWLDADIVIMNSSIPLESIIPYQEMNEDQVIDLIVTTDRRFTANSGAWLIRNTVWSQQFLNDWWDLKSYVRPSGLSLSGDNDAFGHMVRRHLMKSRGDNDKGDALKSEIESPSSSQHIRMIPRCTMNSFGAFVPSANDAVTTDITKEEWYINPDQWYYSGDFIAHASGIDQKDAGIKLLLSRAT